MGVDPDILRSDEAVEQLRQRRAEQQRQAAMAATIREGAGVAKDLAGASLEGDNALKRLLDASQAGALA
jgi:hypothetical protein